MTVSFATQFSPAPIATLEHDSAAEGVHQCEPQQAVGQVAHNPAGIPLTDEQREAAIKLAGKAVERHMARYEQTHCFGDYGLADRARLSMEALKAGRSPEAKARAEGSIA
jgi:hypothetical protein